MTLQEPLWTIDDDEDDFGTDIRMHEELKRVKMENSRVRRPMRTASNQARKHWRRLETGFNQVCTFQFESVTRASLVRPFFSCQFLICMPLLGCHVSGTCSNLFFRVHVADPLMMHCVMGSVRSTSRGVAFDIWPRVVAWRWQSDAASLEFHRIVLVLHSWWTFTARR